MVFPRGVEQGPASARPRHLASVPAGAWRQGKEIGYPISGLWLPAVSHAVCFPSLRTLVLGQGLSMLQCPRFPCLRVASERLWQSCGAGLGGESLPSPSLPPRGWLLITLGSRWRRPGLAAIGPVPLPTLAGWFQEATPAFHLGRECWSRAEKWRQPAIGLGEQVVKGVGTCATPQQDYVQLSWDKTRRGGSEAGATAPRLGI